METRQPVLIVEDDPDIRDAEKDVLELAGYPVYEAANGREGLAALERIGVPCIIVLDLMMPVMDGVQFLSELKRRAGDKFDHYRVMIVSADQNADKRVASDDVTAILAKPFEMDAFLTTVREHCG